MKSLCIVLLIALSCLALAEAQCPRVCTRLFSPVCASWTRRGITDICTFPNECTMRNQICKLNRDWILRANVACTDQTRNCRSLLQ
ncbi:turripeptide Gsg9.2 isoform X1 [Drosophila subobscura]|uniref:turripeptide Gsg9.2 isoform X1 n=1 Tax=Drosophila subobscura TaxID=7241 RepID=UPI00155A9826|nr:turripeptide Gsg9.2 isoform X1 [Drosophila subobscura]